MKIFGFLLMGVGVALILYTLLTIIFGDSKGTAIFGRLADSEFLRKATRILSIGIFGRTKDDE